MVHTFLKNNPTLMEDACPFLKRALKFCGQVVNFHINWLKRIHTAKARI